MPTVQAPTSKTRPGSQKDPYGAYLRHERKHYRAQVAVLIGLLFLTIAIVGSLVLWRLSEDERVAAVNTEITLPN